MEGFGPNFDAKLRDYASCNTEQGNSKDGNAYYIRPSASSSGTSQVFTASDPLLVKSKDINRYCCC